MVRFGLGTTAVTNVIASRSGRRVGLITTRGFETLVPLARGRRVFDDGGFLGPPPPIVPARLGPDAPLLGAADEAFALLLTDEGQQAWAARQL